MPDKLTFANLDVSTFDYGSGNDIIEEPFEFTPPEDDQQDDLSGILILEDGDGIGLSIDFPTLDISEETDAEVFAIGFENDALAAISLLQSPLLQAGVNPSPAPATVDPGAEHDADLLLFA